MSNPLPTRRRTIAQRFSHLEYYRVLFEPGKAYYSSGGYTTNLKYDGEILSLRLTAKIYSLPQLEVPDTSNVVSQRELDLIAENIKGWSKIGFGLFLSAPSPQNTEYLIGEVAIYPIQPYYQASLSEILSDLTKHPIEHGWKLVGRIIDYGYGRLKTDNISSSGTALPDDEVIIHGAAQEVGEYLTTLDCQPFTLIDDWTWTG
jgi:hypothetical protein